MKKPLSLKAIYWDGEAMVKFDKFKNKLFLIFILLGYAVLPAVSAEQEAKTQEG